MTDLIVQVDGIKNNLIGLKSLVEVAEDASLLDCSPEEQETWLLSLGDSLTAWGQLADFSVMREAESLYWAHKMWEASSPANRLHPNSKLMWHGDFYKWANAYVKRRGQDQSKGSIQNKIRVYRNWKSPEATISVPEVVCIPKRQEGNVPVEDPKDPDEDWEAIDTNLDSVDYGKLLVATSQAKKGNLGCDVWTAIFDPQQTVADVQRAMREDEERNGNGNDPLRFYYQDGVIYAREDGLIEGLALFLSEDQSSPLFQVGAEHLLKAVGIKENPFVLSEEQPEAVRALAWSTEDEFVVSSKDGYRVGAYSRDEAEELRQALGEFLDE